MRKDMKRIELPSLPLETSDFTALRETGQVYVDKTALVCELASQRRMFLFSRPLVETFQIYQGQQIFQRVLRSHC